jgi:hypothetical protein
MEISTKKTKVFGFVGTDHIRTKIIINDETLEQVNQFTYLGCNISYQFSNDLESKLAKFLQLIGTIKRLIDYIRVRDFAGPLHLGLMNGPFVPHVKKSREPCSFAKAPEGPQTYTLNVLQFQNKEPRYMCLSEAKTSHSSRT